MRKTLFRRAVSSAAALGLTSLALLGADAAPAQAAVSDCPTGYFCAWADGSATGTMFKADTNTTSLGTWANKFQLVMNRTSLIVCAYDEASYGNAKGYRAYQPEPTAWSRAT